MLQSTLTTSNPSSLKNNLQPPYKLLFSFSLLSMQLQLLIQTPYIKTSFWLFLVIQLHQNISLQMAGGLWTLTVFFSLTTESIYYLLVISIHIFSSIIMTTSLLDIIVKTKHQDQFTMDISSPAFMLMYNNSASLMLLVCNPSYNVTSPIDLSNSFLSLNNYGILFLWTSSRNFHHSLGLTLSWPQSTNSLSR